MSERDGFPPGVPCWVDIEKPDTRKAAAFYGGLFGWEMEERMPPGSEGSYVYCRLRGRAVAAIASQDATLPKGPGWNTYIRVESADETARRVTDAGGRVIVQPFDVFVAGRMAVCSDPSGAAFRVWQPGRLEGAQLVNEPGAWNWSELATRDPEGMRKFYGAVFGWRPDTVDLGDGEYTLWRIPGYDAVEGPRPFRDVVAGMMPMSGRFAAEVPPHWGIQFAVHDADAAVEKAARLGGSVISEPVDAPFSRTAVLADPQGAVFTVNRLKATYTNA